MAVAIDGTPANSLLPYANARQSIRIIGSGYNRFTEIEFPTIATNGDRGFGRVAADAVSADGTIIEVVVPDNAINGIVRIAGAPGAGLFLQITPTIRQVLPSDPSFAFDVPVEGTRVGLLGSGFVEGRTRVTYGGVFVYDNTISADVDVLDNFATLYTRNNGRLDLTVPERALAGPVRVETDGGSFAVNAVPIRAQALVELETIVANAAMGTPASLVLPSANTGQTITLTGFGFTTSSNVLFAGVAEDGTRGTIVVQPVTAAADGTQMTVVVPPLAVTGAVGIAGSSGSVVLQIVPTLNGIGTAVIIPGNLLRLAGSGIPEGGPGLGEEVTFTFGAGTVIDTSGSSGPDVFSALVAALEIDLTVPAGANGTTVTVTTAGGSATFAISDLAVSTVPAESQGAGALDGVGGTLVTAATVAVGPSTSTTITGRINTAPDVDLYRLLGAEAGGILSLSATGAQSTNARFRLFDANGNALSAVVSSFSRFVLPPAVGYYVGYSGNPTIDYSVVDGSGTVNATVGDYSLALRYSDPGATSLNAISSVASFGTPGNAGVPSANNGQPITIFGENLSGATRSLHFFQCRSSSRPRGSRSDAQLRFRRRRQHDRRGPGKRCDRADPVGR